MEKHIELPLAGGLLVAALIKGVPLGGGQSVEFKRTPGGTQSVLHSFSGRQDP